MKTIITQVGSYTTSDAVADAVVQYWLALAEDSRADVVDIPVTGTSDEQSSVRLALGAMTPIAVVDADPARRFDDGGAADPLLAQARSLRPRSILPFAPEDFPVALSGYDNSYL